ncbi:hypothetical protein B296_00042036 [Ensete ventricosum]|uniref:Uncharacterized protein n=1 Tax=Ensete ventricosum TaxID=4639 RepID=A0A426XA49_ENSVE|nr:hypothetical protein B296_00042036 [Ensete ventricosum]
MMYLRRRVVSPFEEAKEREREPIFCVVGRRFYTEEEVVRMFDLTPAVTSGMTESYSKPVDIVVWDEDMMHHAILIARGGGVGWRIIRTSPPRMLILPPT